jgi:dihydropteroate synthase
VGEIVTELEGALCRGAAAGVSREQLIVDPGIGFSKTGAQSLEALRRLPQLSALDRPVLVGPSRKSFMADLVKGSAEGRVMGTAGAVWRVPTSCAFTTCWR